MGTSREPREEEIRLDEIFYHLRNLDKMLWFGGFMLRDIEQQIDLIKNGLDEIYDLLERREYKNG